MSTTARGATLSNFIGGEAIPAVSRQTHDDHDPATKRVVANIPRSNAIDVDRAVEAAQEAFPSWSGLSLAARADLLDKVANCIEARQDQIAKLESVDTGKPLWLAKDVDIPRAVANFRFFAQAVRQDATACHTTRDALNYTLRRPLGPVALITPWNLPLYLLSWKTAPALAMGNTVVAKPSELTPLTASALADVFVEVGAPPGIFNVVHGLGSEAGQALVEHPGIKAVSFTGGTETGKLVAAAAAPQFKKLSLELGGKNATVVFADADLDLALEGAVRAGFTNQGQVCLCGSRILVESSIHDEFVEKLVARVSRMTVGDPRKAGSELGSLISLGHRTKVEGYIKLAAEEGGQIRCGGKRPTLEPPFDMGSFLEPTVITGLAPTCRTATEEIFGPVVTVHPFESDAEALEQANGTELGLSASVWTRDLDRAHHFSAALDVGMVWVNTWMLRDLRVPFGGTKSSGVGREGGRYSLDFFSQDQNICIKLGE